MTLTVSCNDYEMEGTSMAEQRELLLSEVFGFWWVFFLSFFFTKPSRKEKCIRTATVTKSHTSSRTRNHTASYHGTVLTPANLTKARLTLSTTPIQLCCFQDLS